MADAFARAEPTGGLASAGAVGIQLSTVGPHWDACTGAEPPRRVTRLSAQLGRSPTVYGQVRS